MNRSYLKYLTILSLIFVTSMNTILAQDCPAIVEEAIAQVQDACVDVGRNQACYGNQSLQAQGRTDTFKFDTVSDVVDIADVISLQADPLDESSDTWGIGLLKMQVNLPDSVPGQNVTFLVFGGTQVENAIDPTASARGTLNARARVRGTPDSTVDSNILDALEPNTEVVLIGRNADTSWLRIRYNDSDLAWVATFLVTTTADLNALPIIENFYEFAPPINPMESFYLKPGVGQTSCAEAPPDGVLIHTPQGLGDIQFTVNEVKVTLGSTLFLSLADDELNFELLTGRAVLETEGDTTFLVGGTQTSVPLSEDGLSPSGAPSAVRPTDAGRTARLEALLPLLEPAIPDVENTEAIEPVTFADPLPEDEIKDAIAAVNYPYGLLPGNYLLTAADTITRVEPTEGAARCYEFIRPGEQTLPLEETDNGLLQAGYEIRVTGVQNIYGDPLAAHDAPELLTIPDTWISYDAISLVVTSPTTFYIRSSFSYRLGETGGPTGACSATLYYEWLTP